MRSRRGRILPAFAGLDSAQAGSFFRPFRLILCSAPFARRLCSSAERCGKGCVFFGHAEREIGVSALLSGVFHLARASEMHIAAFAHGKLRLPGRVLCFPQGLWRGNCPNAIGRSCQTLGCSRAALCGASLHVPGVVKKSEVFRLLSALKKSERCVCFLYFTRAKKTCRLLETEGFSPLDFRATSRRTAQASIVESR